VLLGGGGVTRSVVVLGAGRSGTSMVAGLLADAGLDPGGDLIPASPANPTGYFEDLGVNRLNDDLLAPCLADSRVRVPRRLGWLAALPDPGGIAPTPAQRARMRALLPEGPFCLKDPRLSYTLAAWRPVLPPGTAFACVFRDPARVVASVQRDARRDPAYYEGYDPTPEAVFATWECAYRAILDRHAVTGTWAFIDADDLVVHGDTGALSRLAGCEVAAGRIDAALRRSAPAERPPAAVRRLHDELRRRASS
jgi:hypothetical protein